MATLTVVVQNHLSPLLNLLGSMYSADVGLSDKWLNDGTSIYIVNNGGGSSITLTEVYGPNAIFNGVTQTNLTRAIPAGDWAICGPYPTGIYNDVNGYMNVQYSAVTTVKVMPLKVGT
jgi:hypothetical protein